MAMQPSPGQMFGRYRVERAVGVGGFGVVYRAHDTVLGRPVALKVLNASAAKDPEDVARFLREGRLAAQLAHPNIVVTYDVGDLHGVLFIAMEWIEGMTLADGVARGLLGERRVALVGQLAEAIAYAHEQGVVHRDVKPANVLVDGDSRVRLADFGIARRMGSPSASSPSSFATQDGLIVGSPAYMAPEQMLSAQVGPLADQFAWGVLAFEALTGTHPRSVIPGFPLQRDMALVRIAPPYRDIVLRAMAFDPDARFPSMRAVAAAWMAASASVAAIGAAPTIHDGSTRREHQTPPRRRSAATVAVVLAAVGLLAIVAVLAVGHFVWTTYAVESPRTTDNDAAPGAAPPSAVASIQASEARGDRPLASAAPSEAGAAADAGGSSSRITWSISSVSGRNYPTADTRSVVMRQGGAIAACFARHRGAFPVHSSLRVDLEPGAVVNVGIQKTLDQRATPDVEACLASALQRADWGARRAGARAEVDLVARRL